MAKYLVSNSTLIVGLPDAVLLSPSNRIAIANATHTRRHLQHVGACRRAEFQAVAGGARRGRLYKSLEMQLSPHTIASRRSLSSDLYIPLKRSITHTRWFLLRS